MTEEMRTTGARYTQVTPAEPAPTGAGVGWVLYAGIMLFIVGTFQGIAGLVALFNDNYYAVTKSGLVITVDYTAWGWVHLAIGVLAIAAGFGVMTARMWARVTAVVIAGLSAIVNLSFLNAAPLWCTIVIALDILVIYAVTAHGRDVESF